MKKLWADRAWDDYLYWQTMIGVMDGFGCPLFYL